MILRRLNILKSSSFFLFGARGTGKSTLLAQIFKDAKNPPIIIDLLRRDLYRELQARPEKLSQMILPAKSTGAFIIIDEVQKVPELLDLVHYHIEKDQIKFALTGFSSRKLKRGRANLLAGRAFVYKLFPITFLELVENFELEKALHWGMLPQVINYQSDQEKSSYLQAYSDTYIREEIVEEQIVRNIPPFTRFLEVAAQANAKIINYSKIARDINTDASNVKNYFSILEETLLGFFLEPYHQSIRKRQKTAPKFYFYDTGIVRALSKLLDVPLKSQTYEFGIYFESFLVTQINSCLSYQGNQYSLSYLRSADDAEIDLIIERGGKKTLCIEIKSATSIYKTDVQSLAALSKEIKGAIAICLYRGEQKLLINDVLVLPWRDFFSEYLL